MRHLASLFCLLSVISGSIAIGLSVANDNRYIEALCFFAGFCHLTTLSLLDIIYEKLKTRKEIRNEESYHHPHR